MDELTKKFAVNLRLLSDTFRCATPLGHRFWMCGGLLLGYFRDAKILDNQDADFFILEEDVPKLFDSVQALENAGFKKLYKWVGRYGVSELTFEKDDIKFEFFFCCTKTVVGKQMWSTFSVYPNKELVRSVTYQPLQIRYFLDRAWLMPSDIPLYLREQYGDWRRPNPEWCYATDAPCNVMTYDWDGQKEWI